MSLMTLLSRIRLSPRDAEMIFDRDEPVGRPTDLVLPRRRWFRRRANPTAKRKQIAGEPLRTASAS
jgi:hypothetical protein